MKKVTVRAPGRINIIGEHTDYNNGFVFPAAINQYTEADIVLNGHDHICKINSNTIGKSFTCDLRSLEPGYATWENYLIGVIGVLQERGHKLKGFDCEIRSTIPVGGGVSSSAALECSFVFALNTLFDLGLDKIEMAKICQRADHDYVGIKSGIMDQFTSMMGREDHAILLDCRALSYDYYPVHLEDYTFILINTNVHHELASSEYNKRQLECQEAVVALKRAYEEVDSLRDANLKMLKTVKDTLNAIAYSRALHVITANDRVMESVDALQRNDLEYLGKLMYESHESLSQLYEVSCRELDFIVEQCKIESSILGARMMGGGFGGCVLILIKKDAVQRFFDDISEKYQQNFKITPSFLSVSIANGAHLVP